MQKKGFVILMIFVVVVTVLFLWNELNDLEVDKKINHEKLADYFTCIGVIATVVTLFYIHRQLVEMKLDRSASIFPDLLPKGITLYTIDKEMRITPSIESNVRDNGVTEIIRPLFFKVNTRYAMDTDTQKDEAFITIENIGRGPAKDIEIKWIYDSEEVKNLFIDYYEAPITLETNNDKQFFQSIGNADSINIDLPKNYMPCCGQFVNTTILKKPILKLELSYKNLFNEVQEKKVFKTDILNLNPFLIMSFELLK